MITEQNIIFLSQLSLKPLKKGHRKTRAKLNMTRRRSILVSTTKLGSNHHYGHNHEELLFETVILGGRNDGFSVRCSSYETAVTNHTNMMSLARRSF